MSERSRKLGRADRDRKPGYGAGGWRTVDEGVRSVRDRLHAGG